MVENPTTRPTWRRSSYTGAHGDNCVECASAAWTTSSYSSPTGQCVEVTDVSSTEYRKSSHSSPAGECVEVADLPTTVAMRDSKNPHLGHLTIPRDEWVALLASLRREEL